ncbi:hypothetical protein Dimus_033689 [Dionaea muscipula]
MVRTVPGREALMGEIGGWSGVGSAVEFYISFFLLSIYDHGCILAFVSAVFLISHCRGWGVKVINRS